MSLAELVFRKSSYSDPERECVAVAMNVPGVVAIRDSKNFGGPILRFTPAAWADFRAVLTATAFPQP